MIINRSFKEFKFRHRSKQNQIIFTSKKVKNDDEVINLIDNFLTEKNSFIFESVEKGLIKGRYTIFGKNPDKIWEFNNNKSYLIEDRKKKEINKIEAYDISHISGENGVASCIVFTKTGPDKKSYRLFNIPNVLTGNDVGSLEHVLERRIKYYDDPKIKPDLVLIDGDSVC